MINMRQERLDRIARPNPYRDDGKCSPTQKLKGLVVCLLLVIGIFTGYYFVVNHQAISKSWDRITASNHATPKIPAQQDQRVADLP